MTSSDDQHRLLRALADELARSGVAGIATSPGSRSVPIVLALTSHPSLTSYSLIDERAAGFFAVGLARQTGRPAVVVCTSGTAAVNLHPAVVEAHEAGVPLIAITADRPAELRDVGAGQAIDQLGLYGRSTRWFQQLDPGPATDERLAWIRQLGCRAVAVATGATGDQPGPVHLNVPLREPLVPPAGLPPHEEGGRAGGEPWTRFATAADDADQIAAWLGDSAPKGGGVIVAGQGAPHGAAALAGALEWPLLADPLSGERRGDAAIAHYDLLLRAERWAHVHRPSAVLRLGGLPTSKPLRRWLASLDCPQAVVPGTGVWADPDGACTEVLRAGALPLHAASDAADATWLAAWRSADEHAAAVITRELGDVLSEPAAALAVAAARGPVVVASSMPIRDCESFWPVAEHPTHAIANRGANGIDGTIATALGVAAGSGERTTLLIGDVAFSHDLSGLAAGARLGLPLTIVLVDNGGGGIFDFLPVGDAAPDGYERHIGTPPGLDLGGIARACGAEHAAAETIEALTELIGTDHDGVVVAEVQSDRAANVALHRRVAESVITALGA
ncbi:MAG: 2-succinyl-5-enolpyruvyl-6-hydroxy-3-cyclohexene-1-carboxylic-acid synthase [Baekduia sp.]